MEKREFCTVLATTKLGEFKLTFTKDGEWVRLADVVQAVGVKAGYSVVTILENLGLNISEVMKDTPTRTHKYIKAKEIFPGWTSNENEIAEKVPSSTFRNCKSFVSHYKELMLNVKEQCEIDGVEVKIEKKIEPADINSSIDIILAELEKIECMKKRSAEDDRKNLEMEKELDNLKNQVDIWEKKFAELKASYDEISRQRDALVKSNADLKEFKQKIVAAMAR